MKIANIEEARTQANGLVAMGAKLADMEGATLILIDSAQVLREERGKYWIAVAETGLLGRWHYWVIERWDWDDPEIIWTMEGGWQQKLTPLLTEHDEWLLAEWREAKDDRRQPELTWEDWPWSEVVTP